MDFQVNINLCRVCMKSENGKSLLENKRLLSKFEFVTHLRVQSDDNLPAIICERCLLLLNLSHKFIQSAHNTQNNLKSFLAKITNDFQKVTKNMTKSLVNSSNSEVDKILEILGVDEKISNFIEETIEADSLNNQTETDIQSKEIEISVNNNNLNGQIIQWPDNNTNIEEFQIQVIDAVNSNDSHYETTKDYNSQIIDFESIDDFFETDEEAGVQANKLPKNKQTLKNIRIEDYDTLLKDENSTIDIVLYEGDEIQLDKTNIKEKSNFGAVEMLNSVRNSIENKNKHDSLGSKKEKIKKNDIKLEIVEKRRTTRAASIKKAKKSVSSTKNAIAPVKTERFFCDQCKRDFSTKTNLTRHLLLHEGKRPFECDICSKNFSQHVSLKQHMLIHTGEKPHVCTVCNRGFTQAKSLVFHMRRHTGNKPHQCDYCNTFFRQKDALKTHILRHHTDVNERTFSCKICNKEMNAQQLRTHMKSHLNNHKSIDNDHGDILNLIDDPDILSERILMNDKVTVKADDLTHVIDVKATSTTEPNRAKKFQCRKCFKCFLFKKNLINHLSIHDEIPTTE